MTAVVDLVVRLREVDVDVVLFWIVSMIVVIVVSTLVIVEIEKVERVLVLILIWAAN